MKTTCTKLYSDIPFAHRQPKHDGHCALLHGHNWGFEFEFTADKLDECGFVIDFGKLKWLKEWIMERFDHTLVLNTDDPWQGYLTSVLTGIKPGGMHPPEDMAKITLVPDCSAEGLAAWLAYEVNTLLVANTNGRVSLHRVTVLEDAKNSATIYL